MNDWVIVVLHDGLAQIEVFGDERGRPFLSQGMAETASRVFPRQGARYSVYVTQIKNT